MSTKLARGRYYGTLQDILASMSHHIQLILVGDFYQLPPVGGEAATRSINQVADPDAIDAGGVAYTTFLQGEAAQAESERAVWVQGNEGQARIPDRVLAACAAGALCAVAHLSHIGQRSA